MVNIIRMRRMIVLPVICALPVLAAPALPAREKTDLPGNAGAAAAAGAAEPALSGPDKPAAGNVGKEELFGVTSLPRTPLPRAPEAVGDLTGRADPGTLDEQILKRLNEAVLFDKGPASAGDKAARWLELAEETPVFADKARERAEQWKRYAVELAAAAEARRKREEARDGDWKKLSGLLPLETVSEADKKRWAMLFVEAYGGASGGNPYAAELEKYLPAGTVQAAPGAGPGGGTRTGKAGIRWVTIPGGSFMMGSASGGPDERPVHRVSVRTFEMAETEVTVAQYRACVDAGACSPPETGGHCNWGVPGRENHPVNCLAWKQAGRFSRWAGGRLPSEAEWEYAARGAGGERIFPWGDEEATCERAVMNQGGNGCGLNSTSPVCSKPAGNTEQGLCDMAGNVWEWIQDRHYKSYDGAPDDGSARENPAGAYRRVKRGGSWYGGASDLRAANRNDGDPVYRYYVIGFRPVRP